MLEFFEHGAPHDAVFVHGAGGNNLVWKRTVEGLRGDGRAVAVDLPGHPTGDITCTTVGQYAEAVHSFVAELGLRRPVVCGHSMGGAIALTFALSYPDDLGGLVLASTGARMGVMKEITDGLAGEPLRVIEKLITPMSFHNVTLEVARESRMTLSISNPAVFLNDYLACNGFDVRARLGEIAAKTLIFCGDDDRMTPPKWSHYLGANIASSAAYFVKDAGHMVILERPGACAALVQAFLAGLSP